MTWNLNYQWLINAYVILIEMFLSICTQTTASFVLKFMEAACNRTVNDDEDNGDDGEIYEYVTNIKKNLLC